MRIPFDDVASGVASFDETRFVVWMAGRFAPAIARHELEHLGMLGGKLVDRARLVNWTTRGKPR